jgi:HEPN domain-containing protein
MRRARADAARQLAAKAENDLTSARILLDQSGPVDGICFHTQQTAEKLLKSLLTLHGAEYPFTHDVGELLLLSVEYAPALEKYNDTLPALTDYAVAARYDDLLLPDREDAARNLEIVERLRHDVYATFPENAIPK